MDLGDLHTEEKRRECYDSLVNEAKEKGFKLGWAGFRYKDAYGEFPPKDWKPEGWTEPERKGLLERTGTALPEEVRKDVIEGLRLLAASRGMKDGWASYRYKEIFGEFPPHKDSNDMPF